MKYIKNILFGILSLSLLPVSALAQTPYLSQELDFGQSGGEVSKLQTFLKAEPAIYPSGLITGYFGSLTRAAVSQFQLYNLLPMVGRVGPMTLSKINGIVAEGLSLDIQAPRISSLDVNADRDSLTFKWNTNELAIAKVFYSTSALSLNESSRPFTEPIVGGTMVQNQGFRVSHELVVSGLEEDTTYHYLIMSKDRSGNVSVILPRTIRTDN